MDTGGRSFSRIWTHGSDVDGSTHDVGQENRLQPNDIVEKDKRPRGRTHSVLPWPHPAAAYQTPLHRPVLPREPQGISSNGKGGITGLPETGEQAYPSPRPTQQSLESEALAETREVREEEKHQKRRRGRPVTRTQATIPVAIAPRAIRPREATHGQEQASVEQPLRSGADREGSNLERGHLQRRATDVLPAPFGSRRGKHVRRPARTREPQEPQAPRQTIPATQEAPAVTEPGLGPDISSTLSAPRRKRNTNAAGREGLPAKRARLGAHKERTEQEWEEDVASVLRCLDEEFAEKERLSLNKEWCTPVSQEKKLSTVQTFYNAFHDTETLPIWTCAVCYRKCGKSELEDVSWDQWESSVMGKRDGSALTCRECFPIRGRILACPECVSCLMRDCLSAAARTHVGLGCEHMFPEALKGLTPVEEKLISLNSCYGFITKYSVVDGQRQGVTYPKHIKGHITVFPNNVQELVTRVLPHPLIQVMDEIHVSWHGEQKPGPSDLSRLLSVRRRVVERALAWLRINNPHYRDIQIDEAEMDSWGTPPHDVPSQILERIERNEPSAWEKVRTAQIVPSAERGIDEDDAVDIDDIMAMLRREQQGGEGGGGGGGGADRPEEASRGNEALFSDRGHDRVREDRPGAGINNPEAVIHEVSSSGMFALDAQPDVADAHRLQFAWEAVGEDVEQEADRAAGEGGRSGGWAGSASVRQGLGLEPYISVSHGDDFADSHDPSFFAKTFPTLFPFGTGGPRLVEENIVIAGGEADVGIDDGAEASARSLLASRNMSLTAWAEAVLRRHGGRFATHHIFAFLVFNLGVRSRNRRVSMLSVSRKDFPSVERIVHSLSRERLGLAQQELEISGQTADEGIKELLKGLSLYGFRQPMSREHRLSLRRKIKSLIIRYGIPAIWFTLNPNDITNPVKLRLAAYRSRDPEEAESFLRSLDMAYKRARLAISDPVSSAIFFHREISLFFEHYVKVGEESVFGRISQYFGAVETNERGALHVHGHLALFVPWECFISESSGDINDIWTRQKEKLSQRLLFILDNIQLLRRSAEDAKRDAKQWAVSSANDELAAGETALGNGGVSDREDEAPAAYRCDNIGDTTRLVDVLRSAGGANQITAGSRELSAMTQQLCQFQHTALGSTAELRARITSEQETRTVTATLPEGPFIGAEVPAQRLLRSIKSQQVSASRETVMMIQGIQGIQGLPESNTTSRSAAVNSVMSGFGDHNIQLTAADPEGSSLGAGPAIGIRLGPSTSFLEAGRQLAEHFTLNRKQSIAFLLICRQLDLVHRSEDANSEPIPQLCQFVGGEGGTGKSRIIEALVELFASKRISNRLLVTATSGTAAARINGITIHSACNFSKDTSRMAGGRGTGSDGIGSYTPADRYVDGPSRTDWRERDLLIIDEVSMLGARTLWMVNEQLCKLRGSPKDFGGIPIVLFCGDFHQFRPVQERSILLPSTAISWFEQDSFQVEQRHQHDKAHALWRRFTTVIMLDEQVRAAGDPELRALLRRIRLGIQDQSDVDLLNGRCHQRGRRIPWESGITVVTPLNRNRWNLNMEAILAFRRQHQATLRIFISDHKWKDGQPTEEEALMMLNHGDDSAIPVPAIFMFVPGMPVVVNQNTHQGLKLVNGASYTALEVIIDKAFPGYRVSADTILHFGPPAGILLTSETTAEFHFVGMPPGTILLTPMSIRIECQRKRPWQQHDVTRKGLPCTPAFACTSAHHMSIKSTLAPKLI
ncbi:ATP-dependent DNA helicase PIF1 [Fusarium oxysporum f. sp. rapae]|uniref:ATP-dependent DNA helicase n=1 Tax=Fusarium oxysporum f. sp. rapae TaxID=485398 RepID=A0A8J5NJJ0_FUSOX|nr:ATP-dependent DNA helicase PIF1 [Fusarium oxysporum f. sp. rapae]